MSDDIHDDTNTDVAEVADAVQSQSSQDLIAAREGLFGAAGSGDTSGYGGLETVVTSAPAASRPFGAWYDEAADVLTEILSESGSSFDEAISKVVIDRGELTLFVKREKLTVVAQALRDDHDLRFEICTGVNGVHYPLDTGNELHAVYHLLSITHNRRIRLEVTCPDSDPHIPSVEKIYPAVNWHERETWDMFGIIFDGHTALTRILMPDDWPGHPQRKDYPLGGINVDFKGAQVPPPDTRRTYR